MAFPPSDSRGGAPCSGGALHPLAGPKAIGVRWAEPLWQRQEREQGILLCLVRGGPCVACAGGEEEVTGARALHEADQGHPNPNIL